MILYESVFLSPLYLSSLILAPTIHFQFTLIYFLYDAYHYYSHAHSFPYLFISNAP